jgi:hypothetical protein
MTRGSRRITVLLALLAVIAAGCGQKNGVHVASSGSSGTGGGTAAASGEGAAAGAATGTDTGTAGATDTGAAAAAGGTTSGGTTAGTTKSGTKASTGTGGAAAAPATGGAAGDTRGITDTEIRIGIHAPVTGAAPFPATSFNDGKAVYFNFLNDKGGINGRKVKVFFQDDGYNPSQAVAVCKKMVEQDKVFLLIGGGGTDQIVACSQYASSVGVPYLAEGVTEQGLDKLQSYFALSMTYKAQGKLLAQYMKNVLKVTKVGMIRGNTANFDDAHAGFLAAAQQAGLQVVKDVVLDKNASSSAALQAGGSICSDRTNSPQAMYPLIAPSIWVQIVAGANAQACTPIWSGVGITEGLNIVATAVCGAAANTKAHFFSPTMGISDAGKFDPDYVSAYQKQNGKAGDDIGLILWGASKIIGNMLANAGKGLSRQSFVSANLGKMVHTGVYPDVNYTGTRFGGSAVHVLNLNCGAQRYDTEATFKTSF